MESSSSEFPLVEMRCFISFSSRAFILSSSKQITAGKKKKEFLFVFAGFSGIMMLSVQDEDSDFCFEG